MNNRKITDLTNNNLEGKVIKEILKEIDNDIEKNKMNTIENDLVGIDIIGLFSIKSNIEYFLLDNKRTDTFVNKVFKLMVTTLISAVIGAFSGYIGGKSKDIPDAMLMIDGFMTRLSFICSIIAIIVIFFYLWNASKYKYNHNYHKLLLFINYKIEKEKEKEKEKQKKDAAITITENNVTTETEILEIEEREGVLKIKIENKKAPVKNTSAEK